MLIVRAVGAGVVPYFLDGRHPGRWSPGATRLLGLAGPVRPRDLRRVLEGRDPASGAYLPARRPARRRGGWDLVFGAPKSLSLATGDPGPSLRGAHSAAVDEVVGYLDARATLFRRDAEGRFLPADGLIAASFEHRSNSAGEPHVHTHVLVANLGRREGSWGAVQSADWFVDRQGLAALYQLALRDQIRRRGLDLEWRLRPDGLADLASVSRALVRQTSSQSRRAAALGRFDARRMPMEPPRREREAGTGAEVTPAPGPASSPGLHDPALERAVALRLAARRSDFRRADVVVTLAATFAGGAGVADAVDWADGFCRRSLPTPSPTAAARWVTAAARRVDDELLRVLRSPGAGRHTEMDRPAGPDLEAANRAAVEALLSPGGRVHFLGSPVGGTDLLAQAEVISRCRPVWERAGCRVEVSAPTREAEARWAVLTGLAPYRPGHRPDVLVVDQADRRPSSDLLRLAAAGAGRLVFVEGGTLPRLGNPASHGLRRLADEIGRLDGLVHPMWGSSGPGQAISPGRERADVLLGEWRADPDHRLLVGLGLEEVRGLNRAALGTDRPASGKGRFAPGDRVVVLGAAPGLPRYGTFGTVVGEVGKAGGVEVDWLDGSRSSVSDRRPLRSIGFGYAATPRLADRSPFPLEVLVLGPAHALSRGRDRVIAATGPELDGPARDRAAARAR